MRRMRGDVIGFHRRLRHGQDVLDECLGTWCGLVALVSAGMSLATFNPAQRYTSGKDRQEAVCAHEERRTV